MRLQIIGSSSAVPRPNRANSCYLIESEETAIALDCGSGAFSRLRAATDIAKLRAIFISHMHADHFIDLIPLRYGLKYEFKRSEPLCVYLHEGGRDELNRVVAPFADDASFFEEVMEFHTYRPDAPVELDSLTVRFARTRHYIEAYAMRVESGTTAMTYSADTAPDESVVDLA
ncbi:MAG: MBL fold metallo-hydrolase, partial [Candidatus Eremiobacteraeota bacterium]|nr:MBL fold metallo-hydrolase [Candidatus Eremiobacteraeota bacterium]